MKTEHVRPGVNVHVGHRFTFSEFQENSLRVYVDTIKTNLRKKPVGWRVLVVQDIRSMNEVIRRALMDSHEIS